MLIKYIFLQLSMYAVLSYILKYNIWHIDFFSRDSDLTSSNVRPLVRPSVS